MHSATRVLFAASILALAAAATLTGCRGVSAPELGPFLEQARTSPCADKVNALYVIDHSMVFWRREGSCADAAYAYTLYGQTPADVLCERHDSIAGPMSSYPHPEARDLFETIVAHLDDPKLGLGSDHTVERVRT